MTDPTDAIEKAARAAVLARAVLDKAVREAERDGDHSVFLDPLPLEYARALLDLFSKLHEAKLEQEEDRRVLGRLDALVTGWYMTAQAEATAEDRAYLRGLDEARTTVSDWFYSDEPRTETVDADPALLARLREAERDRDAANGAVRALLEDARHFAYTDAETLQAVTDSFVREHPEHAAVVLRATPTPGTSPGGNIPDPETNEPTPD